MLRFRALLFPSAALFLTAMLLVPGFAAACHPGPVVVQREGIVASDAHGPVAASIRFGNCAGHQQVTVTLDTPEGPVVDTFDGFLKILAPPAACLTESCTPVLPPVAAFRITAADGTQLEGLFGNAAHFAVATQLAGTYRGQAAAFTNGAA